MYGFSQLPLCTRRFKGYMTLAIGYDVVYACCALDSSKMVVKTSQSTRYYASRRVFS